MRNVAGTPFDEDGIRKIVELFANTKRDVVVTFDKRIRDFGHYFFDYDKNSHVIRISPVHCTVYNGKYLGLDRMCFACCYVGS